MAKETFYFPHDFEPTSDPKIQALIGDYGGLGYGIYWRIIEMLHSDPEHKLPHKKYIILAIAKQMLASVEQIEALLNDCIKSYELLDSDTEFFWSKRVNRNFERRIEISKLRSYAGKKGAIAKQNLANASKGKESKVKESKGKEIKKEKKENNFIFPTISEVVGYFVENGYTQVAGEKAFRFYNEANWVDSKGNKVRNWKQKMQGVWFKDENKAKEVKKATWVA